MNRLQLLYREAGCDQGSGAVGAQLLSQGPTDTNLLQFLGVIEQRVQEMAQLHKLKHGISMQGVRTKKKILRQKNFFDNFFDNFLTIF